MAKQLTGAVLLGQSGGPTSVINSSAAGVFLEALKKENVTKILAASHGIKGILNEEFYDIRKENIEELELLLTTPSSAIGSVRYKLKDIQVDEAEYIKILSIFKKYNIRFFFYNGGNDSMDTCNKISKFINSTGYECRCIGIPKTIDNDLDLTDHSPGYGSAAKYIATTFMELYLDATVYDTKQITIVEVMGRNAGWLTASSFLATHKGFGPDLIYLPEKPFDDSLFFEQVLKVVQEKGKCIVAISEGIKTSDNKYMRELFSTVEKDSFGHAQLGGTAVVLANEISKKTKIKVRSIELSLLQRCASHLASSTDIMEAFKTGEKAVIAAVDEAKTDIMVAFKRISDSPYEIEYVYVPLEDVANKEKSIPLEWIKEDNTGLTDDFINYLLPLIQGENQLKKEDGLPRFAKLNKILYKKIPVENCDGCD
ncbi:MAG: 6-phosphofructokinase [Acholeplasmatales bacterium]|jgi:6-phosphofructokinase 1|nr:6-phosphofructokinase [Acholeplasmatales bacterium]